MKKLLAIFLALCMALLLCGCSQAGNEMLGALTTEVVTIVARVLEAALAIAFTWLIRKAGENANLKNTQAAMEILRDVVVQTVGELQQLYVNHFKEINYGKLDPEDIRFLKDKLYELVYEKISAATMQLIEASGADVEALIQGYAESYLNDMKNGFWNVPTNAQADTELYQAAPTEDTETTE